MSALQLQTLRLSTVRQPPACRQAAAGGAALQRGPWPVRQRPRRAASRRHSLPPLPGAGGQEPDPQKLAEAQAALLEVVSASVVMGQCRVQYGCAVACTQLSHASHATAAAAEGRLRRPGPGPHPAGPRPRRRRDVGGSAGCGDGGRVDAGPTGENKQGPAAGRCALRLLVQQRPLVVLLLQR